MLLLVALASCKALGNQRGLQEGQRRVGEKVAAVEGKCVQVVEGRGEVETVIYHV